MARKASWMSSRRSQRMRNRRYCWSQAIVRSTTQRFVPSPEPCPLFGHAILDLDVTAAQFAASFARVVGAVSVQAQQAATRSAAPVTGLQPPDATH
jgi:hypothetical protein